MADIKAITFAIRDGGKLTVSGNADQPLQLTDGTYTYDVQTLDVPPVLIARVGRGDVVYLTTDQAEVER